MTERPHVVLRIGLLVVGLIVMYLALFFETATSATNEYRLGMTLGLILMIVADAVLYWVYKHGGVATKVVAVLVALPGSQFVAYDWLTRWPSVFLK